MARRTKDSITIHKNKKGRVSGFSLTGSFADNFVKGLMKASETCTCKQGLLPCAKHGWKVEPT